jgi:hypothetical protein
MSKILRVHLQPKRPPDCRGPFGLVTGSLLASFNDFGKIP